MDSQDEMFIRLLLAVGASLAVPLALPLLDARLGRRLLTRAAQGAGTAFALAMVIGSGPVAIALAAPLACGAVILALAEVSGLAGERSLGRLAVVSASCWLAGATADACLALTERGAPLTSDHLRWPTPAHFLFAGFGLTTLALRAHRARRSTGSSTALVAVLAGMPLLAVEIAFFPMTQWTGAVVMSTAAVLVAVQQLLVAARAHEPARSMLVISGVALAAAMVFAVAYGLATHFALPSPTLSTMVRTHGVLNSIGFVVIGMVAWRVHTSTRDAAATPTSPIESPT